MLTCPRQTSTWPPMRGFVDCVEEECEPWVLQTLEIIDFPKRGPSPPCAQHAAQLIPLILTMSYTGAGISQLWAVYGRSPMAGLRATREASKNAAGHYAGIPALVEKCSQWPCACTRTPKNNAPRRVAAPMRLRDFVFATARMRSRPNKTFRFTRLQPIRQQ